MDKDRIELKTRVLKCLGSTVPVFEKSKLITEYLKKYVKPTDIEKNDGEFTRFNTENVSLNNIFDGGLF